MGTHVFMHSWQLCRCTPHCSYVSISALLGIGDHPWSSFWFSNKQHYLSFFTFIILGFVEIEKFIIRQPPKGEKDDYDSENSWISDGLSSSSRRRRRGDGRWKVWECREKWSASANRFETRFGTRFQMMTRMMTGVQDLTFRCTSYQNTGTSTNNWLTKQPAWHQHQECLMLVVLPAPGSFRFLLQVYTGTNISVGGAAPHVPFFWCRGVYT